MFGGMDPKKMQAMMRQMGIKQEELEASRVIIECLDKKIVIDQPSVVKIEMQGNVSWQISGKESEEVAGISEEDVQMVSEKTGVSLDKARKVLQANNGDIAATIIELEK